MPSVPIFRRTEHRAPVDGCPQCGRYDNQPTFTLYDATRDGYQGFYFCEPCQHFWTCSWGRHAGQPGPEWVMV